MSDPAPETIIREWLVGRGVDRPAGTSVTRWKTSTWHRAPNEVIAALDALVRERDEARRMVRDLEADPDRPTVVYAGDELEQARAENERLRGHLDVMWAEVIALAAAQEPPAEGGDRDE